MKDSDYNKAKKMFFKYDGSHYAMWHDDDVLGEYEQFEVPEELEREWLIEILDDIREEISTIKNMERFRSYFFRYIRIVKNLKYKNGLYFIKRFFEEQSENMNSFTLIRSAEDIFEIINIEDNIIKRKELICDILKILRNALKIIISDDDKVNGVLPKYKSNDKIVNRLQNIIKKYEKELYSN